MKADFSRDTFDPTKNFSRVLMQQGRVTLDADNNEQVAILLHYLRTLTKDLIGPFAGPAASFGFGLEIDANIDHPTLQIGKGRYYVDGILCENHEDCLYSTQPDYLPGDDDQVLKYLRDPSEQYPCWIYLDVWERHITSIEDAEIREKALRGPDTCTRGKVVWQVKGLALTGAASEKEASATVSAEISALEKEQSDLNDIINDPSASRQKKSAAKRKLDAVTADIESLKQEQAELSADECRAPLALLQPLSTGKLAARVDPGQKTDDPCLVAPAAKYRGLENQLYRVEIHRAGDFALATFKWARDNGSRVTSLLSTEGNDLTVANPRDFAADQWVEYSDDLFDLSDQPGPLAKLVNVDGNKLTIDPNSLPSGATIAIRDGAKNPKIRRWDQAQIGDLELVEGAIPVHGTIQPTPLPDPSDTELLGSWIDLEDGLQVQFTSGKFNSGDYWLIPARVATGGIEWPVDYTSDDPAAPKSMLARGVHHHYAPLGILSLREGHLDVSPCRCEFHPLNICYGYGSGGIAVGADIL